MSAKRFLPILTLLASLTACGEDRVRQLEAEQRQLKEYLRRQDSLAAAFFSVNQQVAQEEGMPALEGAALDPAGIQLQAEIAALETLIEAEGGRSAEAWEREEAASASEAEAARQKGEVGRRLSGSESERARLRSSSARDTFAYETYRRRLDALRAENEALEEVRTVQSQYLDPHSQARLAPGNPALLKQQTQYSSRALYAFGDAADLEARRIIRRAQNRGNAWEVNPAAPAGAFAEADAQAPFEMLLPGGPFEIISKHPAGSYEVRSDANGAKRLVILNPSHFWGTFRYLVVVLM
jgi:hypothetical protein